jgi:hypothetical protein
VNLIRFVLLAAVSTFASATWSCELPLPFEYVFHNNVTSSLAGTSCALTVSTTATSRTTAAAFFHYRRPSPLTSVRYGFRLDSSALSTGLSNQQVRLFSATSSVVGLSPPTSDLLAIELRLGTPSSLLFAAADASSGTKFASVALSGSVNTVRVEINTGATGNVKYWINHAFTDPPDGVIETTPGSGLDNADLQGVIGAEIGLSNPTKNYRALHSGEALVFDQIESSDDIVFYDDFSSGAQ